MNKNKYQHYRDPDHEFSNQADYPLMREFLAQLVQTNPYSRYGVHAVGIGGKVIASNPNNRLALCFFVACKVPLEQLPRERRIPGSFKTFSYKHNREVELVTDVIATPPAVPLQIPNPEQEVRPVPGGVSCSADHNGTIGGWVWDNTDDTVVMLSNLHVFGDVPGTPIIQPGSIDFGNAEDRIGQVKRGAPIYSGDPQYRVCLNLVDAAIGEADGAELIDASVLQIGPAVYKIREIGVPDIGLLVQKFGQTTGHTSGLVLYIDYAPQYTYNINNQTFEAVICDCLYILGGLNNVHFQRVGDSGSIVFSEGGSEDEQYPEAVGLLFAGNDTENSIGNYGVACKITNVFSALDLDTLCPAACYYWVDVIAGWAAQDDMEGIASNILSTPDVGPPVFTNRERQRRRAHQFHAGLAHDLRRRLRTSTHGRGLLKFSERHRGELLTLAVKDGDTRRSMVAALRPIFRGAVTTTDVLQHKLTEEDIKRLDKMVAVLNGNGSKQLRKSLKVIQALLDKAEGRTLAEVLYIAN